MSRKDDWRALVAVLRRTLRVAGERDPMVLLPDLADKVRDALARIDE